MVCPRALLVEAHGILVKHGSKPEIRYTNKIKILEAADNPKCTQCNTINTVAGTSFLFLQK